MDEQSLDAVSRRKSIDIDGCVVQREAQQCPIVHPHSTLARSLTDVAKATENRRLDIIIIITIAAMVRRCKIVRRSVDDSGT